MPCPPAITTLAKRRGTSDERETVGAHRARAGPRLPPRPPVEVEERPHRPQHGVDPAGVERRRIAGELHRSAEADAVGERRGDGVRLLHDDRVSEPRARGEGDVVALTGDDLEPQIEHPAEGADPRTGGEDHFVGGEAPAARADGAHPIADHVEAGDPPMLEQRDVARPEGGDEAVDVPSGVDGAIAGKDEAGPHVVRESRHHGADALTVEQRPGTGEAERDHALQLGMEAFGERHVVERDDDVLAARDVDAERGELAQALVEISPERGESGLTGIEARPVGGAEEADAPAQHRRDGARPDAQRPVTRGERCGGRAQHARPGQR